MPKSSLLTTVLITRVVCSPCAKCQPGTESFKKEQTNIILNSLETDVPAFRPAHLGLSDLVYPALLIRVYIVMSGNN